MRGIPQEAHYEGGSGLERICRSGPRFPGQSESRKIYVELLETPVKNDGTMSCRMFLQVHILDANRYKFKENMGTCSEKQGEHFHQDILDFERRYQGQYNENIMGDYIRGQLREIYLQFFFFFFK